MAWLIALTPGISQAQNKECEELAQSCSDTLSMANDIINDLELKINYLEQATKKQQDYIIELDKQIVDYQNPSWYNDPKVVGLLGVLTGILITVQLQK